MAVRPVVIWPDDRLRQASVAITDIDESVRELYRAPTISAVAALMASKNG